MNFKNKRFITSGVDSNVSSLLQLFMWHCIDAIPPPKDYLQIFELSAEICSDSITTVVKI